MVGSPRSTGRRALVRAERFIGQLSLDPALRAAFGLSLKTTIEGLALATVTTTRTILTTDAFHAETHCDSLSRYRRPARRNVGR